MVKRDETVPPPSGEVDAPMRVVVLSTRARLSGEGDVLVANDLAELLMALDEGRRVALVVDTRDCTIELGFFVRIARDFPPGVAIVVLGDAHHDRRVFHDHGVFRAQFEPEDALLHAGTTDRTELVARVRDALARAPTPAKLREK